MVANLKRRLAKCLLIFACVSAVLMGYGTAVRADFKLLHPPKDKKLLIFVHGLWGDPEKSFFSDHAKISWFEIVKSDAKSVRNQPSLSTYGVGVLSFPASRSDRLSIPQVARILLRDLRDAGVMEDQLQLYFIAHSLGGLAVKEMMLTARENQGLRSIFEQTRGIFFISTPTSGSEAAEFISNKIPKLATGRLMADLKTIGENSFLQSLQERWDDLRRIRDKQPGIYCAYETKSTHGLMLVPQQYAEKFCDEAPEAIDEDHITIVKPSSVEAQIHQWLRGSLANLVLVGNGRPPQNSDVVASPSLQATTEVMASPQENLATIGTASVLPKKPTPRPVGVPKVSANVKQPQPNNDVETKKVAANPAAVAPPPSPPHEVKTDLVRPKEQPAAKETLYRNVMRIILSKPIIHGNKFSVGRVNNYREVPQPKAMAACIDWERTTAERPVYYYSCYTGSGIYGGAANAEEAGKFARACCRAAAKSNCTCVTVDVNDQNVLEIPRAKSP